MKLSSSEKSLQKPVSVQHAHNTKRESGNNLRDDYLLELKEWIQQVINIAEKNGDVCKRDQFLALKAEIF